MVVRILIADDHEIVRRGLRALLETRDDLVVCAEAQDGREAVDLAIQHKPDIAVLDVSLPTLNGIEATRQIRRDSPYTEVLVFTMHNSDELISEVYRGRIGCEGLVGDIERHDGCKRTRPYLFR